MDEHLILVINTTVISSMEKLADALDTVAADLRSGTTDGVVHDTRGHQIGWFLIH